MKKVNYNNTLPDKTRIFPVDPSLPRWACQNCHQNLSTVAVDLYADNFFNNSSFRSGIQVSSSVHGTGSLMESSTARMDQSFVVLPKQRSLPRPPRGGALQPPDMSSQVGKMMEDSFVVLPPPAASVYNTDFSCNIAHHCGSGLNSTLTVLNRAFDIATNQTQVEQPLCLECMRVLSDKLDKEFEDVNRDIHAYEACLQRMEGESINILSEQDFLKEKLKIEKEERKLEAAIEEIEKQCAKVTDEKKELETKSSTEFGELEERYWKEFNNYQFQLTTHQEESDAILARTEVRQAQLELLKRTSLLNDAFRIGHDKEFGTINNFRLGRFPTVTVEWDETNAAWGQACLLLHTMTQNFRPKFLSRIKILPMGSYPCIVDSKNNTFELFGPVNMFRSTNYDKAMTMFLTCLKDFSEFANCKDKENKIPLDKCFKLPYKIENDKVDGFSIIYKEENSTKALRYMLCDLKQALNWFVRNADF